MADKIFADGIIFKLPSETAPDYVKGKVLIKSDEAIKFIQSRNSEWVSLDLLVSKGGKPYVAVDDWKPDPNYKKPTDIPPERERKEEAIDESLDPDRDLPF